MAVATLSSPSSSTSSSKRVSCLGFISPRSATLLLALVGFLIHVQQFNYLTRLHDTFPHVPHIKNNAAAASPNLQRIVADAAVAAATPVVGLSSTAVYLASMPTASSAAVNVGSEADGIVLDPGLQPDTSNSNKNESDDTAPLETKLPSALANTPSLPSASSSWREKAAAVKPSRWFNLLPTKAQQSEGMSSFNDYDWKARQREQDEDRKSWEAARMLTKVMRLYALVAAITCIYGFIGVIRSNLFCTRVYVLSSSLDLIFSALSLLSLGIIVTYPNVRSMICEELSTPSTVMLDQPTSRELGAASTGPVSLLGRAANSVWQRSLAATDTSSEPSDSLPSAYWWASLFSNLVENENCDDVLESVLIPVALVASLIYIALRIHFLVVIRHYYVTLLREQMGFHLSAQGDRGSSSGSERKYSSSSASSNTSHSDFTSCLLSSSNSSKPSRFDSKYDLKVVNEKIA